MCCDRSRCLCASCLCKPLLSWAQTRSGNWETHGDETLFTTIRLVFFYLLVALADIFDASDSCHWSFHSLDVPFHLSSSITNCQQVSFVSISHWLTMLTNNPRPAFTGGPAFGCPKLVTDSCRNVDLPLAAFNLNHMVSSFPLGSLKRRRFVFFTCSPAALQDDSSYTFSLRFFSYLLHCLRDCLLFICFYFFPVINYTCLFLFMATVTVFILFGLYSSIPIHPALYQTALVDKRPWFTSCR